MALGHKYGLHRVLEPKGFLPQAALRLDNTPSCYDNEMLIDVTVLNITSTAFRNMEKRVGHDPQALGQEVLRIVNERGKFQDPETGSGGMLIGRVQEIGSAILDKCRVRPGDRVATLVSLSLTPLFIEEILKVNPEKDQVYVKGKAVLFESGLYAPVPDDLPEELAVAVMDVAGAPAYVAKKACAGDVILVVGAGKAGLLCLHEAMKRVKPTGMVIAVEYDQKRCQVIKELGLADYVLNLDARNAVEVMQAVEGCTKGKMASFSINVASVPETEMATILSTRDGGTVVFYSMSTLFTRVALGTEGVGKELILLVGSGYTAGHDEITYNILRENPALREFFMNYYCAKQE